MTQVRTQPRPRTASSIAGTALAFLVLFLIGAAWLFGALTAPTAADADRARAVASEAAYDDARADAFDDAYGDAWSASFDAGAALGRRDGTRDGAAAARRTVAGGGQPTPSVSAPSTSSS